MFMKLIVTIKLTLIVLIARLFIYNILTITK